MSENEAEAADADDAESAAEGLQDGDFVELDYTLRTTDDDEVIDTTHESVAEEAGIADEDNRDFTPRTIIIGDGHVFESVDDSLRGSEVGDGDSVIVTPEEGFGEYDPEEVRTVSAEKIPEDDRYPGNQVTIDGEQGFVETIIGGRARVDFNHPLAGDTLEYDWEVVGTVDDREERAQELLQTFLDIDLDVHFETDIVEEEQLVEDDEETAADADDEPTYETVEVEQEALYIDATMELTMNQQWMMGKQQIGQQLIDLLDIDRIVVQEVIEGGGLPGMMGGMGGMGGGGGGGDLEAALEDADIDADELTEEIE